MLSKTVKTLGRNSFEIYIARWTRPGYGSSGRGVSRGVVAVAGEVTYSPYKVPAFKRKIARCEDATSTLMGKRVAVTDLVQSRFKARQIGIDALGTWTDAVASGSLLQAVGGVPTSAPATNAHAQAVAAERFLADYYDKTRSLPGSSAVAELASTVRGLASPAKALRKEVDNLYSSLRGRLYRNSRQSVKDARRVVAGTWLEWNFGIQPIVNDVNGAAQAINRMRDGDYRSSIPIRGTGVYESLVSQEFTPVPSGNPPGVPIGWSMGQTYSTLIDRTQCTIRGAVRVTGPGQEVPPAMQWGLTAEDLLPGVWEGIPWSWFIDYFVNVSSVIQSWSFISSRLAWCNRTVRNSRTRTYSDLQPTASGKPPGSYFLHSAEGGHCMASYTSVLRSPVLWSDVAPPLRLRLPGVGSTKWANVLAVAQMWRSGKKAEAEWFNLRRRNGRPQRPTW